MPERIVSLRRKYSQLLAHLVRSGVKPITRRTPSVLATVKVALAPAGGIHSRNGSSHLKDYKAVCVEKFQVWSEFFFP